MFAISFKEGRNKSVQFFIWAEIRKSCVENREPSRKKRRSCKKNLQIVPAGTIFSGYRAQSMKSHSQHWLDRWITRSVRLCRSLARFYCF
jgi:hypothetical protein